LLNAERRTTTVSKTELLSMRTSGFHLDMEASTQAHRKGRPSKSKQNARFLVRRGFVLLVKIEDEVAVSPKNDIRIQSTTRVEHWLPWYTTV
jgi:hypothetical protein